MNSETTVSQTHGVGPRVHRIRLSDFIGRYVLPRSAGLLPIWRYILLLPPVFAFWFHARRLWWRLRGVPFRRLVKGEELRSSFVAEKALPYNLGNLWIINRARTERLMMIMRAIRSLDLAKTRMLVIGPRNEAELLLLSAYGFRMRNLTAIDLFSYAPTVALMDMHSLKFPDNAFDAVYSAFVITYSDEIPKAIQESIRVARKGALMVFVFEHLAQGAGNLFGVNRLSGGPDDLLSHFAGHVDHVFWKEDYEKDKRYTSSVIFRLKK